MNPLSFEDLNILAQNFMGQFLQGDFAAASSQFDNQMRFLFPEVKLQELWQRFIGPTGNLLRLTVMRTVEMEGYRVVFIKYQFEKAALNVQIVFNIQGQISGLNLMPAETKYHTPDYVDISTFREVDVTVGEGQWALPGTLTLPHAQGIFPGVVLVQGSGPSDRDETIGPNKIFRDLAWGLVSQGIAVLRYEKRTFKHAQKFTPDLISRMTVKEEVMDDAILAIQLMRQKPQINSKQVFLLGHSLGATLAPRIGQQDPGLAGLVIMAGITRPLEDIILDQFIYLNSLAGPMTDEQKTELESLKAKIVRVKDPELSDNVPAKDLPLGISAAYWLDLRGYNPTETVKKLNMPVLILQGGRDYQVLPEKDFESWKTALNSRSNVYLKLFSHLNHLFIVGEGKSTPQEYGIEGHVDKDVIFTIAQWIKRI